MAGDIVKQLRDTRYPGQLEMREAAADEIERLRLATQYLKDLADRWWDQSHVIASVDLDLIRQAYSTVPPAECK